MSVLNGINGWAGTILRVNLTNGSVAREDTLPKYKPYIGGMGIGYKIIWDEVPLDTEPFSEEAKVVFSVGPLTGSGVPCSGRTTITLLSNWSRGKSILDAHMGGHFAHSIKYAGYDAIVIEGKSSKPVYLKIEDDKVSLEDASHVWGTGTFNTNKVISAECGAEFDVASIGAAGENLVNMSCIVTSFGNSGGAGVGGALGAKNLKAIAIRGTGAVKIADPVEHKNLCDYMIRDLVGGNNNHNVPSRPQSWAEYTSTVKNRWQGGPGVLWGAAPDGAVDTGEQPSGDISVAAYRATKGVFDFGDVVQQYIVKSGGCASCPVRCYSEYNVDVLAEYDLPTLVSNTCVPAGSGPTSFYGKDDMHDFKDEGDSKVVLGLHGAYVMDDLGLWENYNNLGRDFAWCLKNGVFEKMLPQEEYDSIPWQLMKDGDPRWLDEIMGRIARKEGELSRIGEGSYFFYKAWGLDDPAKNEWGVCMYDVIGGNNNITYNGYPKHHANEDAWQSGLLYNVLYNRDCMDHVLTNFVRSGSPFNEVIKPVLESYFGEGCVDAPKAYTPINDAKIKLAKWAFLQKQWHDSATLCNWMYPMTLSSSPARKYVGDIELDAKYMTAVTGEEWTMDDILFCMERVSHMLRGMTAISFKIHEGLENLRKDHDAVPAWVFDKDPDIPAFGEGTDKMDREDWEKSLTMFYEAMGWNTETGIPTRETLEKFDLGDMADKLEELGLI